MKNVMTFLLFIIPLMVVSKTTEFGTRLNSHLNNYTLDYRENNIAKERSATSYTVNDNSNRCTVKTGEPLSIPIPANGFTGTNIKQQFILTGLDSLVQFVENSLPITNIPSGNYLAYVIGYDSTGTAPNLSLGSNINNIDSSTVTISIPLEIGICDCNNTSGQIIFSATGKDVSTQYEEKFLLTDGENILLQIGHNSNFTNLQEGIYNVYAVNYDITGTLNNLTVGNNITDISGDCYDISPPLGYVVCLEPCELNCDTNGDGFCDVNCDADGDGIVDAKPEIIDPCNCLANESSPGAGDGQFSETVTVKSKPGETWTIAAINGLYQNPAALNFPPASGNTSPYSQIPYALGTALAEININSTESRYILNGIHVNAIGYQITVTNGVEDLSIGNTCNYNESCGFSINTAPDGTPGQPIANNQLGIFIIPTETTAFIDTLTSCDPEKNTFTDDGLVDGLYQDTAARNNIITLCPQNKWQRIQVNFTEFDLAAGDVLYVYDSTTTSGKLIATMTGTGVSQANGGWVAANCDPSINPDGCLTFRFTTNGDLNKGSGWLANVTCNESSITLSPPNNLNAKLECDSTYAIFEIKPITVQADCGTIQDSQIVRVFNQHGVVCLDTCLADADIVRDTFAIGSYLVSYKLKSDTTKTAQTVMTVQGASLVCNDEINVSLGSNCSIALMPDDLLESTCDTIIDTVYYHITLKGLDKNGNELVLATGGGKGGVYPVVTKEMIEECGGSITAEIEKRYYEDLALSFCNNGQQSVSCEVKVNIVDQSPPIFMALATVDTFVACAIDLTQEGLGIPTPTAIDNCDSAKVEFAGGTLLNEGGACDTTRAIVNWTATDACGNVATASQNVIFVRPSINEVVKTGKLTLSCDGNEDGTAIVTDIPGIKIGHLKNGVLIPSDTIPLSTEEYICGFILENRDITIPSTDCGKKIFRYWTILDWCDANSGPQPVDTTIIEFTDTKAPTFAAGAGETTQIALDHFSCTYDITKVVTPAATDNCSTPTVHLNKVSRIENGETWAVSVAEWASLGCDSFQLEWIAEDACHEQLVNDTLIQIIEIKDVTKPSVVCNDKINLSIGRTEARLHYRDIDAGSDDACGIAKYEVSRDEINWDSIAIFSCEDIHKAATVYLRVTDYKGNQSTCWMHVNVEDKIAPICSDLPEKIETCDGGHIGTGLSPTDSNDNGKMEGTEWVDLTAAQAADFNTKYGHPNCSDNVTCNELVIQQQYQFIVKSCGMGTIKRRYRAIDWDGEGIASNWSEQTINIESKTDWSITLPADWQGECGETVLTSELIINNGACALMGYDVEEKVFSTADGAACMKVVRTFTIINWCKYQAGGETITISRTENEDGIVTEPLIISSEGYENVGKLEYVQILKLKDETAPMITIEPVDDCIETTNCEATKYFAIRATDCNEVATAALRYSWTINEGETQLAAGIGAEFEYPIASNIKYEVEWTVADNCGNTAIEKATYQFTDCKKPAPYCLHGVAVELMPDAGMIQIWASDIDAGSKDNCTVKDKLETRIWHESLGDAPTHIAEVLALPENITLTCAYLGNQAVNLYVIDEANNWDYCTGYINVQDNMGACENAEPGNMALVSGTIMNWKEQTVEAVRVKTGATEMMTQADGRYDFELAMNRDYTIQPTKYVHPLNGVSTFDLVLMAKHILGITEFTNPYQMIAADVNGSGTITAFDMVQIRQLILNINTEFNNSPSWKFVYAGYEFPTESPMSESYPQVAQITDLQQDMHMDFIAIKMGDVNGNARPSSLIEAESRTTKGIFEITTEDKDLKAGETYNITFSTKQLEQIQGYQFTLGYENLKVEKLKSGVSGVENFGLHKMDKGMITMSWNQTSVGRKQLAVGNTQLTTDNWQLATLFTIEFTATKDDKLSEQLSLLDRPTAIEAYDENSDLMDVLLMFTTPLYDNQFELFQNQPNPFHEKTMIGFYLPRDSEIQLILRDEVGRVLRTYKENRKAGYNTMPLDKGELTNGFIYYQLSTKYGTQAKKMLKLK